jgi:glucose/arabinose dehydrogenase
VQECAFNPGAKKGDPDYGLLYIEVGDGGASEAGYPFISQDKSRIWGSLLRIDPSGNNSKNGRYGIPATNPYAGFSDAVACREIFCRGFRNPNRFTWAPDGQLLIADIGQTNLEELNLGVPGGDYGWPNREGTFLINPKGKMDRVYALPPNDNTFQYRYPIVQYDHDEGKAIEGGFAYTGTAVPQLRGKYIFGDINNGRVFFVENGQPSYH